MASSSICRARTLHYNLLATALTEWQFLYVIRQDFCPRCINFSCPLNAVAHAVRDAYLAQHPAMRQAWEKGGYRGR